MKNNYTANLYLMFRCFMEYFLMLLEITEKGFIISKHLQWYQIQKVSVWLHYSLWVSCVQVPHEQEPYQVGLWSKSVLYKPFL